MDVVTRHNDGLFPKPARDRDEVLVPRLGRHVQARRRGHVRRGRAPRREPDLLFLLRKVDHLELIADAVDAAPAAGKGKPHGKKTIAAGDLADVFGIELTEPEPSVAAPAAPVTSQKAPRASSAKTKAAPKKTPARAAAKSTKASTAGAAKAKATKPAKSKTKTASRKPVKAQG